MRRALAFSILGTLCLVIVMIAMNENAKYYRSLYERVMEPHETAGAFRFYEDRVEVNWGYYADEVCDEP